MAHGNPRINICWNCNHYITVSRFKQDPICPICGEESVTTNKSEIMEKYNLYLFYNWSNSENEWTKLQKR